MVGCGNKQGTSATGADTTAEAVSNDETTEVAASATPDLAAWGLIQAGQVRRIYTQDITAERPEMLFTAEGRYQDPDRTARFVRDAQGRVTELTAGKLDKDTVGMVVHHLYTYNGKTNQVRDMRTDDVINKSVTRAYTYYSYTGGRNYPTSRWEISQADRLPLVAVYTEYDYTRYDEQGNWIERTVHTYYIDEVAELSNEFVDLLGDDAPLQAAIESMQNRITDMTPNAYQETRQIEYY